MGQWLCHVPQSLNRNNESPINLQHDQPWEKATFGFLYQIPPPSSPATLLIQMTTELDALERSFSFSFSTFNAHIEHFESIHFNNVYFGQIHPSRDREYLECHRRVERLVSRPTQKDEVRPFS